MGRHYLLLPVLVRSCTLAVHKLALRLAGLPPCLKISEIGPHAR